MRPDHGELLGSYVRVIHDFQTTRPGEICLARGDVFKVTKVVDKNWLQGTSPGKQGNFPYDFVEKIRIPIVEQGQKVFAATEKFPAAQDGDLAFNKGDVIIGLYEIDQFWWQGRCEASGLEGMFPTTHVMELELSSKLRQRSKSVHSSEPLFAQALVDARPQLDEELGFSVGDIITVTEVVDEDWYIGECHNRSGMFLATCVQLLNEDECAEKSLDNTNHRKQPTGETSGIDTYVTNTAGAVPITADVGNVPNEISVSQTEQDHSKAMTTAYTSENTKSHSESDAGVTPYARTLYPFTGELADELSFEDNDIVTLIQHVDGQWIEGEIDGKIGVFPANYVEIVVDCPYAFDQSEQGESLQADSAAPEHPEQHARHDAVFNGQERTAAETATPCETITPAEIEPGEEHYALVLYTFAAEAKGDLSVHEGETVTLLNKIDDNWLLVKNDAGESGMIPVSFVDIIGSLPELPDKSHDKNKNEVKTISTETIKTSAVTAETKVDTAAIDSQAPVEQSQGEVQAASSASQGKQLTGTPTSTAGISASSASQSTRKTTTGSKPGLKPKPALAPKPALKPKPSLGPKPFSQSVGYRPVSFDPDLPKSSSSSTLSAMDKTKERADTEMNGSMTKAQSMFEINSRDKDSPSPSLEDSSETHSGSASSVTVDTDKRSSAESKAFQDWDMSKPLDAILKDEFSRAKSKTENNKKLIEQKSSSFCDTDKTDNRASTAAGKVSNYQYSSPQARPKSYTPNYSRENFEFDDFFKVGNSSFYVQDINKSPKTTQNRNASPKLQSLNKQDFERRPSLKKPAPPRPVGPRVPPMPSRTPMVPVRTVGQQGQAGSQVAAGSRPGPRRHARPAPPRPQPARKTTPPKQVGDDLMRFSPPHSDTKVEEEDEADSDTVIALRARIADMENDLKGFEKSKAELTQMNQSVGGDDTGEIHDNIQFYDDNIRGITDELKTLKASLAEISPRDMDALARERAAEERRQQEAQSREETRKQLEVERAERRVKRVKVIEELVQTEQDFITSMNLIIETFLSPTTPKHHDVDMEQLFGNIEEVAEVSQKLLTVLEEATQGKDFSEQLIGTCFICLAEDMKNVYAPYCRNHDNVINLIEKYEGNAETKAYLDGLLDQLREKHVVFDLEALLIKPVQRILKYPLLLNALIKATEDDHPDKKATLSAINAMTDVATAINEYKRRKDLVFKYKKDTDASLGDKLSKLNLHSLKKKSSRIRERFSANLGIIDQTKDTNFDKAEAKFRQIEKTVKVFVRNVQSYMEEIQNVVSCQESVAADIEDFYGEMRDVAAVQKYQTFHNTIRMTFLPNLQCEVDELVVLPLNQVIQMFEGPSKVMEKRYDKLLDYDNMKRKLQNDKVSEKDVQAAKVDYEAMNAQLLEELPRFTALTFKLFRDCVGSFVTAQRDFTEKITHDMYDVLDLNLLQDAGVIETFNIQHSAIVDRLAMLSFMPRTFSPRVTDQKQDKKSKRMSLDPALLKSGEAVPQVDSQRVYVTQQYAADRLYAVSKTHLGQDGLDLSLCEGDVVGLVMDKDPMGNKDRWFVDNGAKKGFVPRHILTTFQSSPPRASVGQMLQPGSADDSDGSPKSAARSSTATASNSAILASLQEEDDMDFALEEDMTPSVPDVLDTGQPDNDDLELYYAEYAFAARNSNEVSMFEHQVVTVLTKHDQQGNSEWWYVDADGAHGYAPALYLKRMDAH